ncbi:TMC protein [Trinorchestia longiramus]|nr:TMC protein [Trinorchestia longiramus]
MKFQLQEVTAPAKINIPALQKEASCRQRSQEWTLRVNIDASHATAAPYSTHSLVAAVLHACRCDLSIPRQHGVRYSVFLASYIFPGLKFLMDGDDGVVSPRSRSPAMGVAGLLRERQRSPSVPDEAGGRRSSGGILRLDPTKPRRRSSATSIDLRNDVAGQEGDPSSPCPSDRLSVTWADGERSVSSDTSLQQRLAGPLDVADNPSTTNLLLNSGQPSPFHQPVERVSSMSPEQMDPTKLMAETQLDDDDMSTSISMILQRSDTKKRSRKRRGSFRRRLTRSSTHTDSSGECTVVEMESEGEQTREKLKVYREVIAGVREQPWPISRKLKLARSARAYLAENEGAEEERLAQSTSTRDICYRHFRTVKKTISTGLHQIYSRVSALELWHGRFKKIESHFGSAVASYFHFLRWVMGMNAILVLVTAAFVIIPEFLAVPRSNTGERKSLLAEEMEKGYDFQVLWNFEGMLRYSPFFYGYYSRLHSTPAGYRVPEAYFLTFVMIFAFSFIMIIRKMAANQRMSKLSYDKAEFTWSLLGGWDYAIGDLEAAQNKVAAINMGFKELLEGDREKEKKLTGWRLIACRCLANLLVLCLLVASAYAVVLLVFRSIKVDETYSWWRQNELSLILTLISQIFPYLFQLVTRLEYLLPRQEVQMQLARIMALNLLNLTTLVFTLYKSIKIMNVESNEIKDKLLQEPKLSLNSSLGTTATSTDFSALTISAAEIEESLLKTLSLTQGEPLSTFANLSYEDIIGAAASTIAATALAFHENTSRSSPVFNLTTPAATNMRRERKCVKVEIPCSTPATELIYDYLIFPNDTTEKALNKEEEKMDENTTTEPYLPNTDPPYINSSLEFNVNDNSTNILVPTVETLLETGNFSFTPITRVDGDLVVFLGNVTTTDVYYNTTTVPIADQSTLNSSNDSLIDWPFNETIYLSNRLDHEPVENFTKNLTADPYLFGPYYEPVENYTRSLIADSYLIGPNSTINQLQTDQQSYNTTDGQNLTDAEPPFENKEVTLDRVERQYDLEQNDVDLQFQDGEIALNRFKRQHDYDHHFSANLYETRIFNFAAGTSLSTRPVTQTSPNLPSITPDDKALEFNVTSTVFNTNQDPSRTSENELASFDTPSSVSEDLDAAYKATEEEEAVTEVSHFPSSFSEETYTIFSDSDHVMRKKSTPYLQDESNNEGKFSTIRNFSPSTSLDYQPFRCFSFICDDDATHEESETSVYTPETELNVTSTQPDDFTFKFNSTPATHFSNLTNDTSPSAEENVNDLAPRIFTWNIPETRHGKEFLDRLERKVAKLPDQERRKLRRLCWETAIGQEIVKITIMDLIVTVVLTLLSEYIRALVVRFCNFRNCCWDLEKQFPGYADFDIAENIFHLINNQGLVWMGMFFSPCLPVLNLVKLVILLYVRSWAVTTSNVPPEVMYKASDNNNFYLLLFLAMLFLCMLPVWFTMIWVPPSWHCGPFSEYMKIYNLFPFIDFISIPFFVIPVVLLLILAIFYYVSLTRALKEANEDLYEQLCHERDEERRKAQEAITGVQQHLTPASRWNRIITMTPIPGRSRMASLTAKLKAAAAVTDEDDESRTLLPDGENPQSPPGDDLTDLGPSEVFDDSLSEHRKTSLKHKSRNTVESKSKNERKKRRDSSNSQDQPIRKVKENSVNHERKVRERLESQGSAGSQQPIPKSPKHHKKTKRFSYPETMNPEDAAQEQKTNARGSTKIRKQKPESFQLANKEYFSKENKDSRKKEVPSTPLVKHKRRKSQERRASDESHRKQSTGKPASSVKEIHSRRESSSSQERRRKDKNRSPLERESQPANSPKTRKSLKQKVRDGPPSVTVDLHGSDKESEKNALEARKEEIAQHKDSDMHTLPVIKISKEDSVERSIEQAKLDRQKAVEEEDLDNEGEKFPMADDSDAPTVHDRPQTAEGDEVEIPNADTTPQATSFKPIDSQDQKIQETVTQKRNSNTEKTPADQARITDSPDVTNPISASSSSYPAVPCDSPDLTYPLSISSVGSPTTRVSDSPDLNISQSSSTPSSSSRKTYVIPLSGKTRSVETTESPLQEADKTNPRESSRPPATPTRTSSLKKFIPKIGDQSNMPGNKEKLTRQKTMPTDLQNEKSTENELAKASTVYNSMKTTMAPRAEFEDDNLSSDHNANEPA